MYSKEIGVDDANNSNNVIECYVCSYCCSKLRAQTTQPLSEGTFCAHARFASFTDLVLKLLSQTRTNGDSDVERKSADRRAESVVVLKSDRLSESGPRCRA